VSVAVAEAPAFVLHVSRCERKIGARLSGYGWNAAKSIVLVAATTIAACATHEPTTPIAADQYDAAMRAAVADGFTIVENGGRAQFCSSTQGPQYFTLLPNCMTEGEWKSWKVEQKWEFTGPSAGGDSSGTVHSGQ
jgi:hypothetical protein